MWMQRKSLGPGVRQSKDNDIIIMDKKNVLQDEETRKLQNDDQWITLYEIR